MRRSAPPGSISDHAGATARVHSSNALRYPNYRRYWFGSMALVFAMQFRFIGSGWLVYELTDSAFWLGVPGIISAIATVLLMLPAGALADRVDNQRLLTLGRALAGIAHLALGLLTVTGVVEVWMVLVWAAVTGALGALTSPAQNALLPRLIERSAMASAVALNGAIWNGMRIIGPALAGIVIAGVLLLLCPVLVGHWRFTMVVGQLEEAAGSDAGW